MSLISAAEHLAAIDRSSVTFNEAICLHSLDRYSECEACLDVCPVDSIESIKPPKFHPDLCQTCLACLPICPTGAYSADDDVSSLMKCAARLEGRSVELLCERTPNPEKGKSKTSVGLRIRHCLASLGTGTFMALVAMGIQSITVRTESCRDCRWARVEDQITEQVDRAVRMLELCGVRASIDLVQEPFQAVDRPLWDANNPPISRRNLFRFLVQQGQFAIARALAEAPSSDERRPGRDHLRIAAAVKRLITINTVRSAALKQLGFATLTISDECSACAACARACPTSALRYIEYEDEKRYQLVVSPDLCVGCDVCVHVCAQQAIHADHIPLMDQVFIEEGRIIIHDGCFAHCKVCNVTFDSRFGSDTCPACALRRDHPFGSMQSKRFGVRNNLSTRG